MNAPRLITNYKVTRARFCTLSVSCFVIVVGFSQLKAQMVFTATNLPSRIGDYLRAYVDTNSTDVSTLLGHAGGPQRWDFSQSKQPNEIIQRLDVVATNDGGNGASFPQAAYAERLTSEAVGAPSWSYYRVVTDQGRSYYGFVDTNSNPDMPVKVFNSPTIDLPDPIHFGQSWNRSVDSRLISPLFTVPASNSYPRLRFWHWFSIAGPYCPFNCDEGSYGYVEIRAGTNVWQEISPRRYTSTGSAVWSQPSVDLTAYSGQTNVQIAFHFHSAANTDVGWYVDDVAIVTGVPVFNNPDGFESGLGDWSAESGTWQVGVPASGCSLTHR